MDLRYIDPQARVLNYCVKQKKQSSIEGEIGKERGRLNGRSDFFRVLGIAGRDTAEQVGGLASREKCIDIYI